MESEEDTALPDPWERQGPVPRAGPSKEGTGDQPYQDGEYGAYDAACLDSDGGEHEEMEAGDDKNTNITPIATTPQEE
jgi:hypothetical protein